MGNTITNKNNSLDSKFFLSNYNWIISFTPLEYNLIDLLNINKYLLHKYNSDIKKWILEAK